MAKMTQLPAPPNDSNGNDGDHDGPSPPPSSPSPSLPLLLPRLDGSTATPQEVVTALETHGAVVIEKLVDDIQMQQLQEDLNHTNGIFYGARGSFAGHHSTRNAGKPLGESLVAQTLAMHPLILNVVQCRLRKWCRRFVLGTCTAINVEPPPLDGQPPAPPQVLHRDEGMWGVSDWNEWLPNTTNERPELSISVMWAVSDFTADNGATRVIPGSHRWDRRPSSSSSSSSPSQAEEDTNGGGGGGNRGDGTVNKKGSNVGYLDDLGAEREAGKATDIDATSTSHTSNLEKQCVVATMPRGSVLLWSGATLHGASSQRAAPVATTTNDDGPQEDNQQDSAAAIRRGLLFIYNLGWLKTEHNWHFSMPHDVISKFPTPLQELMGIVGHNRVDHPWYTGPVYAQPLLGSPGDEDDDE